MFSNLPKKFEMLENDQKRKKSDILFANQLKLVYKWQCYACDVSINCTKHLHVSNTDITKSFRKTSRRDE